MPISESVQAALNQAKNLEQEGNPLGAIQVLTEILVSIKESSDDTGVITILTMLGKIYLTVGNTEEAFRSFDTALQLAVRLNLPVQISSLKTYLAIWHQRNGDLNTANEILQEAIPVLQASAEPEAVVHAISIRANILIEMGRLADAIPLLSESINLYEHLGILPNRINTQSTLARLLYAEGDQATAMATIRQCVQDAEACKIPRLTALTYGVYGDLLQLEDRLEDAQIYLQKALAIFRQISAKRFEATTLFHLAGMAQRTNQDEEALKLVDDSIELLRSLNEFRLLCMALQLKARLHETKGEEQSSYYLLYEALSVARNTGSDKVESDVLGQIGEWHFRNGEYWEAIAALNSTIELLHKLGSTDLLDRYTELLNKATEYTRANA